MLSSMKGSSGRQSRSASMSKVFARIRAMHACRND
jgi:hypothetical protein